MRRRAAVGSGDMPEPLRRFLAEDWPASTYVDARMAWIRARIAWRREHNVPLEFSATEDER